MFSITGTLACDSSQTYCSLMSASRFTQYVVGEACSSACSVHEQCVCLCLKSKQMAHNEKEQTTLSVKFPPHLSKLHPLLVHRVNEGVKRSLLLLISACQAAVMMRELVVIGHKVRALKAPHNSTCANPVKCVQVLMFSLAEYQEELT